MVDGGEAADGEIGVDGSGEAAGETAYGGGAPESGGARAMRESVNELECDG